MVYPSFCPTKIKGLSSRFVFLFQEDSTLRLKGTLLKFILLLQHYHRSANP